MLLSVSGCASTQENDTETTAAVSEIIETTDTVEKEEEN